MPEELRRMPELAYNIIWSWEPIIRALFRRLDPLLWRECGYNPVLMLGRISQAALEKAAADHRYISLYTQACQRYDDAMQRRRPQTDGKLIAYFSAEYGLSECLPIYSGGLGILSGDHLKSASDCDLPLVGVGLLYQQGYFRQYLNQDGWQQERYPTNDFYTLPHRPGDGRRGQRPEGHSPTAHRQRFHPGLAIDVGRVRCTCSIPTSRTTCCRRIAISPIRSTAAIPTRASGRRSCWASAGCAR